MVFNDEPVRRAPRETTSDSTKSFNDRYEDLFGPTSTYQFELNDLLRPALYVFGLGSWLLVMGMFLWVYRTLVAGQDLPEATEDQDPPVEQRPN